MKTLLLTVLSCAVAFAPIMGAEEDQPEVKVQKNKNRNAPVAPRNVPAPRTIPQTPKVQQNVNVTPRFQPRVNAPPNRVYTPKVQAPTRTFTPVDQDAPRPTTTVRSDVDLQNQQWRNRKRKEYPPTTQPPQTPNTTVQPDATVQSNNTVRNRDWRNRTDNNNQNRQNNSNRNWQNNNNRNWQNNTSGTFTYDQARRRHHRDHHNRSWWRSRYNRIALFGGGYYYWDNNYWYPAYGYDPYYSTYSYDEPIYGYNNLEPGQVIASVQTALQEQGYYRDAVDGLIGPRTRAALSNFQRDHNLSITAAIDGPTLQALGLY